MSEIQRCFH